MSSNNDFPNSASYISHISVSERPVDPWATSSGDIARPCSLSRNETTSLLIRSVWTSTPSQSPITRS